MLGGCLPMFIQLPIWIGLYQAITSAMAASPVDLFHLSQRLYPWATDLAQLIPLQTSFLGIPNLAYPAPGLGKFILPILVAGSTYLQQRVMTPPNPDAQASAMTNQMNVMMPLMMGFFALNFASGLAIYWTVSNLVGIAQYKLLPLLGLAPAPAPRPAAAPVRSDADDQPKSETTTPRVTPKGATNGRTSTRKPVKARRKK
jgi:YidC/Oxa1 family membrane protein insertase